MEDEEDGGVIWTFWSMNKGIFVHSVQFLMTQHHFLLINDVAVIKCGGRRNFK